MEKTRQPLFCDTCGGTLRYSDDGGSAACPYCGNEYKFVSPKSEALSLALSRANAYRLNCDFEGAMAEYRLITVENPEDAEAHWGLALSKYGIEYITDPSTGKCTPTCHRTLKESILDDPDYLDAIKYADESLAVSYKAKAEEIDRLQCAIKDKLKHEKDYDVFLCFRATDDEGAYTGERTVARRIYDELTRRGIKTFFSEVTLKGRLGEDYEPIIYKALYGCKFFILIVLNEENIDSPWVKNEWSRFRDRLYEERLTNACCAVFSGISAASLPAFIRTQGVDLAKYPAGGYEIDIADNLETILSNKKNAVRFEGVKSGEISSNIASGKAALSCGDFIRAAASFSRAIDEDPECGDAWLGAFLADAEVRSLKSADRLYREISNRLWSSGSTSVECRKRIAENERLLYTLSSPYYKNAVKYCSAEIADKLIDAKHSIMDIADKCNSALKLSLEECLKREKGITDAVSGNGRKRSPAAETIATAAGAVVAGSVVGGLIRRVRRSFFRNPPPPGGPGMRRGPGGGPGRGPGRGPGGGPRR